jgi:23S rRNA (adenine2503-C2)-methyltransferase
VSVASPLIQLDEVGQSSFNRRFVVTLADRSRVEAVLYRGDTLCVSTQVGCAVGCPFCASGADGLVRPLRFEELRAQVEAVEALAAPLRRVTASGVGEPLHAPEAVLAFLGWCRERGTPASFTTSGGPLPRLAELLAAPHIGATISVHAGTEEVRARLVPRGPALDPLFGLLREVLPRLSRKRRKKVALAYLLLDGQNDSDCELAAFAERARPLGVAVHLYQHNPVERSALRGVSRAAYEQAYERLRAAGLLVRMSSQARLEANGGCGTLVAASGRPPRRTLPQVG